MKSAMQKMDETVSYQATLVASLTKHITKNGGGGGGRDGGVGSQPTVKKYKNGYEKYKNMVWHKEADFLEYKHNKHKLWVGWESALK